MRAERDLDTMIVGLAGEFDQSCDGPFQDELGRVLDGHTDRFVLDLRGLEFIDSTGLRMLVQINNRSEGDGFDFTLLCRDGKVREVLRLTGLDGVLPLVEPRGGMVPPSDSPL
jgi:anti-sigma B factor antagonist